MLGQYTSYFNQKKKKKERSLTQRCNSENTENDGVFQTPSKWNKYVYKFCSLPCAAHSLSHGPDFLMVLGAVNRYDALKV